MEDGVTVNFPTLRYFGIYHCFYLYQTLQVHLFISFVRGEQLHRLTIRSRMWLYCE